jgi:hypothetical protein
MVSSADLIIGHHHWALYDRVDIWMVGKPIAVLSWTDLSTIVSQG